ncbi:hypothetical protein PV378_43890, partial [Streptomyces scabiei]|uniref:hypothetical protein n=1 Tax=Streptomyces scabiei TaxID=1930 RepID=UPI0029AE5CE9
MTTPDDTPAITDTHVLAHPPGPDLTAWLADTPHTLDGDQLTLHTDLGDMQPRPGWTLLKWTDGEITVASPRTVERVYGPHGQLTRYTQLLRTLTSAPPVPYNNLTLTTKREVETSVNTKNIKK